MIKYFQGQIQSFVEYPHEAKSKHLLWEFKQRPASLPSAGARLFPVELTSPLTFKYLYLNFVSI